MAIDNLGALGLARAAKKYSSPQRRPSSQGSSSPQRTRPRMEPGKSWRDYMPGRITAEDAEAEPTSERLFP